MATLKSLKEHNLLRAEMYRTRNSAMSGLACPECGLELMEDQAFILTSDPPQTRVSCACGFGGYKVV